MRSRPQRMSFPDGPAPFAGRLAVVTGAGSGIGRATALALARGGAEIVCADIDEASAQATAQQARGSGANADAVIVDVSDAAAMERFAETVAGEHRVPDVVVNNAGIAVAGPLLDTGTAEWERLLGVNLWGVIHGCRLFARQMVDRGQGGQIVNTASAAAFAPSRTLPAYCTSKAAVLMLSECLRAELAGSRVGVTAVCPGVIDTNITRVARFVGVDDAEQERLRTATAKLYGRRNYTPERVADAIVRAIRLDLPVIAVSPEAKGLRALSRISPRLSRALARVDTTPR